MREDEERMGSWGRKSSERRKVWVINEEERKGLKEA